MKRIIAILLSSTFGVIAQPVQTVVPNNAANVEGNSNMSEVFETSLFRMQIVIEASQFGSLSSEPGTANIFNSLWFRLDGASTDNTFALFVAAVTLSITPRGPDNLSPVFADNIGSNPVTVYADFLHFGGPYSPGADPQPFIRSALAGRTPFYYNPAQGNLLVDITAGSGGFILPGALDAQSVMGDGVSRVFSNSGTLSGNVDTLAPVMRLDFVVPEPSTWLLATAGLALAFVFRRRPHNALAPGGPA